MMSRDELLALAEQLKNWGRWGPDDQRGTTNLITAEAVLRGVRSVQRGKVFSLAIELNRDGPQITGAAGRFNPLHYMMRTGGDAASGEMVARYYGGQEVETRSLDDVVVLPMQAGTQWDSLAHIGHRDVLYNGVPIHTVSSFGARYNGIEHQRRGIASRGVLIDVARARGVEALEPGTAIGPEELDRELARTGVRIEPGDIVLVRTGWLAKKRREGWGDYAGGPAPGLALACLPWLKAHDVAAVASDTWALEVRPGEVEGVQVPFHLVAITYMGLSLGEIWDLEELAEDAAADGQYTGFLVAPPLPVTGAVGSPVNPLFFK
ncbi:MAG: cyclase family protein [Actinomycetia bacterium]|nr:cyclase family protein [Actinomycetes bacterium]